MAPGHRNATVSARDSSMVLGVSRSLMLRVLQAYPGNAGALVKGTGATELHASCRTACPEDARLAALGFGQGSRLDPGIVHALVSACAA